MKSRIIPPDIGEEDNTSEEPENQSSDEYKKISLSTSIPTDIAVAIERMQERITAFGESREANNERFTRMSEEIGELRAMIVESQKSIKEIEVKATLASDMVKEVHPETLSIETRKLNTKFEALNAEISSLKSFDSSIFTELKEIKRRVDTFKGADAIMRLHDDIKKELIDIQKTKLSTDADANKVEQIFIDIQRNFSDFQKLETTTENAITLITTRRIEVNALKLKILGISNKRDLEPLRKAIRTNNSVVERLYYDVQKNKEMINVLRMIEIRISEMMEMNRKNISAIKIDKDIIRSDMEDIYSILRNITKKLNTGMNKISLKAEKCLRIINDARVAYEKGEVESAKRGYIMAREVYLNLTNKERHFVYTELSALYNELKNIARKKEGMKNEKVKKEKEY